MADVLIKNNTIHAAKAILYKNNFQSKSFPVVEETDTGLYGFPGGAQEVYDKTIQDTLIREVKEEIGLSAHSYTRIGKPVLHHFVHSDKKSHRFGKKGVLHVFLLLYNGTEQIVQSDEIKSIAWLGIDDVLQKLFQSYDYWPSIFQEVIKQL